MALEDNRYRLHEQVALFCAFQYFNCDKSLLCSFEQCLFGMNNQKYNKEEIEMAFKNAVIDSFSMLVIQEVIYAYEMLKDNLKPKLIVDKTKFLNLKLKADINGKLKEVNPQQMFKIIRNCLAHNDDSSNDYTWEMGNDHNLIITYSKRGKNLVIKLNVVELKELLNIYMANAIDLNGRVAMAVEKNKLKNAVMEKRLQPGNIHKFILGMDNKIKTSLDLDKYQKKALYNFYSNENLYTYTNMIENSSIFPLNENFIPHLYPNRTNAMSLFNDCNSLITILRSILDHANITMVDLYELLKDKIRLESNKINYNMLALIINNRFVATLASNILFSIVSCINSENLKKYFPSNVDVNRIRNSLMHGRFFYNNDYGFEFYDGVLDSDKSKSINRIEDKIEHIATLTFEDIDLISQLILADYYNKNSNLQNRS